MCVCVCVFVCVCVYIHIYIIYIHTYTYTHTHTHTHERGLTCVHHVVVLQEEEKNDLLFQYAKKGATGGALMALQAGADVNHKDMVGYSCLHIAAAQGSHDILRILLNAGAKVSAKNKAGNTAVELAQNAQTIDLLKGAGATMPEFPVEKKNNLLLEYAKKGATGGALMELQAGADVNHNDRESATALHWAAI